MSDMNSMSEAGKKWAPHPSFDQSSAQRQQNQGGGSIVFYIGAGAIILFAAYAIYQGASAKAPDVQKQIGR